ncbi:hypothetical protein FHS22_007297 [Planomonospora venezuelensis]|uniref:Uncharacterized protein n=1 Tax=Planomonospora venezuelensis TaxID=1999 RepID=A0A841DES3_PLAVE|nr:hypothetical protein [Planomonospora venezuelensis]
MSQPQAVTETGLAAALAAPGRPPPLSPGR